MRSEKVKQRYAKLERVDNIVTHFYTYSNKHWDIFRILCRTDRVVAECTNIPRLNHYNDKQYKSMTTSEERVTCPDCMVVLLDKHLKKAEDLKRRLNENKNDSNDQ